RTMSTEAYPTDLQDPIPDGMVSREELRQYDELTARQNAAMARVALKREAAIEVVHGSITLDEAADRVRAINMENRDSLAFLRSANPGVSEEALNYWNVIGFVRGALRTETRVAISVERLEAQVPARFASDTAAGPLAVSTPEHSGISGRWRRAQLRQGRASRFPQEHRVGPQRDDGRAASHLSFGHVYVWQKRPPGRAGPIARLSNCSNRLSDFRMHNLTGSSHASGQVV